MKNLDYYLRLNVKWADRNTYLSLIQPNISGGRIKKQDIDKIKDFPDATGISISGLTQDTFDYFIENYGHQFKAIIFWKCPLVGDLTLLESLAHIEYIVYFWNQRAEKLWDFSKTKSLKGFSYDDFTRMYDISEISKSPSLEELHFGDMIWDQYVLNTLHPIRECVSLKSLSFSAKKIIDQKIEPISYLKKLEQLSFPTRLFTTEQVAWLKAHLPSTVTSKVLNAYWTVGKPLPMSGKNKDTFIVGKRKPFLDSIQDKVRIQKYVDQFNDMYQWYLENGEALPEDYKKTV
ncbi:MAG TPA: hypothetical protein VK206_10220 [Anaerolineales bacterium]|nr:hypothetical protein [Anaerolineales bacterium]